MKVSLYTPYMLIGRAESLLYSCFNFGPTWGRIVNAIPGPFKPQERTPVSLGWAREPVWRLCRREVSFVSSVIRIPDRPAHNLVTVPTMLSGFLQEGGQSNEKDGKWSFASCSV